MKQQPFLLLFLLFLLFGCKDERPVEERYAEAIEAAKTTTQKSNELFLDLELGMTASNFYSHCTELNRQRLITQGTGGNRVKYELEELDHPALMNFFPDFTEGTKNDPSKIYAMDIEFNYEAWAPWNKELAALPLLRDVTEMMIDWYGDGFMAIPHEKLGRVVVQVKNNRRIAMWVKDQSVVRARITDMSERPEEPMVPAELSIPTMTKNR